MKRILDVALASAGLLVGAPALALAAAAIKLESPGPVVFSQLRVGRGQRPFRIYKLRTMRSDARGASVTAAGDPRITRVGRVLRKTKLDELPQLWNVLRGDMSMVGPRPEVPEYVARYRPEWMRLLSVRPGMTDLASLVFRDEEALLGLAHDRERAYTEVVMPMKLQLALDGLTRDSVLDDVAMMARTALAVVRRKTPAQDPVLAEAARRIAALDDGSLAR